MPESRHCDVLVLGAGPAGSTLAALLAEAGVSVIVVDQEREPAFKVGESLLPEGIRLCRELGLGAELARRGFQEKHAARFVLSQDGAADRFAFSGARRPERGTLAYQVKRRDFDGMLAEHAAARGAAFRWDYPVERVDVASNGGVTLTSAGGERLGARFLADASGPAHVVGRALGLRRPMSDLKKAALFAHFRGIPRDAGEPGGDIVILWSQRGWFWIIPFADGTASVGVVGDAEVLRAAGATDEERFDRLCEQSDAHRAWLGARVPLLPIQRRSDYSFRCEARSGERWLAVGDAAGFIDPIFSTGVFLAQNGAFLARDALVPALGAGRLPSAAERAVYEERLHTSVERFLGLVHQFYDTRFMDNVVRSRKREEIRRALTSLLAGDVYEDDNPFVRFGMLARA